MTEHEDAYNQGFDDGYAEGVVDRERELEVELARYRTALERISAAESGAWGFIANEALRGGACARR